MANKKLVTMSHFPYQICYAGIRNEESRARSERALIFCAEANFEADGTMTKAGAKAKKSSKRASAGGRGSRKPADLEAIRKQINELVGSEAVNLVESTIAEADKGHYSAMKYLFEMIGLYPATGAEAAVGEDSLAKTLLRRLGLPEEATAERAVTKDSPAGAAAAADDAVK
jgi:hypothetical protein